MTITFAPSSLHFFSISTHKSTFLSSTTLYSKEICFKKNSKLKIVCLESKDRIESVKSGLISAFGGSFLVAPFSVALTQLPTSSGLNSQWELSIDMFAASLFLYGIIYRYTIREDDDYPMLNSGIIGAFTVIRVLSMLKVDESCTPFPLYCGPPLNYFSWNMIIQGITAFVESFIGFTAASYCIEFAFRKNWLSRAPMSMNSKVKDTISESDNSSID